MDIFLMQYLNNKFACEPFVKVSKSGTPLLMACGTPLRVLDWKSDWPTI